MLATVHLAKRTVWSLAEARASLERLVGSAESEDWSSLDDYLMRYVVDPTQKATVFASSFAAALELCAKARWTCTRKKRSHLCIFASMWRTCRPTLTQRRKCKPIS